MICCLVPAAIWGQGFTINTVAGNGTQGYSGDNIPAVTAQIYALTQLTLDAAGNLYIADTGNHRIRKVTPDGTITTVAGNGNEGFFGDGGPALLAELDTPRGVAVDAAGNLYIADTANARIRKVSAGGVITTIAGDGNLGYSGDSGPAAQAEMYDPRQLALDTAGNLYLVDRSNQRIRKIATDGTITTVAGSGKQGYAGDGGLATAASLYVPDGMAVDAAGNIYICEAQSSTIRKVTTDGIIHTLVGTGKFGFGGDGGPANLAQLNDPQGVAVDAAGNVYVADEDNQRIRMVTPDGIIQTIAGNGTRNFSGDGGPSVNSTISLPQGIAPGPNGIYFVDQGNNRVRVLTPAPSITTGGIVSASDYGQFAAVAPGTWMEIYGSNLASGARQWAGSDFTGSTAPVKLNGTSVTIGGKAAFVEYVSAGQVVAQVPSDAPLGVQPVIVTTAAGSSAAQTVNVTLAQPGLLAPGAFKVGGKQNVVALFNDGFTYVLAPGAIPGLNAKRAKPGDIVTMYGIGFGGTAPAIAAGQIVGQQNTLASTFTMQIGGANANLSYSGLAPGLVGLYQFNVTVPPVTANDASPVTFTLGGTPGAQTLYLAVGN
ncbi:MAG TPA: hypothetical protein VGN17_27060 [Bryobacteraceae bacterium]|jgi:uncharacterized protein (TIGR03437 family)